MFWLRIFEFNYWLRGFYFDEDVYRFGHPTNDVTKELLRQEVDQSEKNMKGFLRYFYSFHAHANGILED